MCMCVHAHVSEGPEEHAGSHAAGVTGGCDSLRTHASHSQLSLLWSQHISTHPLLHWVLPLAFTCLLWAWALLMLLGDAVRFLNGDVLGQGQHAATAVLQRLCLGLSTKLDTKHPTLVLCENETSPLSIMHREVFQEMLSRLSGRYTEARDLFLYLFRSLSLCWNSFPTGNDTSKLDGHSTDWRVSILSCQYRFYS